MFVDLNGDGAPDLYVANDFEDPDQYWINDGHGHFQLAPWYALRSTSNSGMAVAVGDVNRDGHPDLFEVDMLSRDTKRLGMDVVDPILGRRSGRLGRRPHWERPRHRHHGRRHAVPAAESAGHPLPRRVRLAPDAPRVSIPEIAEHGVPQSRRLDVRGCEHGLALRPRSRHLARDGVGRSRRRR